RAMRRNVACTDCALSIRTRLMRRPVSWKVWVSSSVSCRVLKSVLRIRAVAPGANSSSISLATNRVSPCGGTLKLRPVPVRRCLDRGRRRYKQVGQQPADRAEHTAERRAVGLVEREFTPQNGRGDHGGYGGA